MVDPLDGPDILNIRGVFCCCCLFEVAKNFPASILFNCIQSLGCRERREIVVYKNNKKQTKMGLQEFNLIKVYKDDEKLVSSSGLLALVSGLFEE